MTYNEKNKSSHFSVSEETKRNCNMDDGERRAIRKIISDGVMTGGYKKALRQGYAATVSVGNDIMQISKNGKHKIGTVAPNVKVERSYRIEKGCGPKD